MNNISNIERIVMRRVHRIHFLRFFSPLVVGSLVLVAALLGIGRAVWVARVFENAPRDLANLPQFYLAAFSQTELIVQLLTTLSLISLIYLARATARALSSLLTPARA